MHSVLHTPCSFSRRTMLRCLNAGTLVLTGTTLAAFSEEHAECVLEMHGSSFDSSGQFQSGSAAECWSPSTLQLVGCQMNLVFLSKSVSTHVKASSWSDHKPRACKTCQFAWRSSEMLKIWLMHMYEFHTDIVKSKEDQQGQSVSQLYGQSLFS